MNPQKRAVITVDPSRNLVKISFAGDIGVAEIRDYETDVGLILATLGRDFLLVTDLTDLNSMDVLCAPFIRRTMDQFRSHGVGRVVRIIPDRRKDIGFNIMSSSRLIRRAIW